MKIFDLLKKKRGKDDAPANGDELNTAVAGILSIEERRAKAAADLERTKAALSEAYATAIAGDDATEPSPAAVIEAQTRLEALERLLRDAKAEAVGTVAKYAAAHRERRAAVEDELAEVRRGIEVRQVCAIAEFVGRNGLSIQWPTQHNAGFIAIPAMRAFESEKEIRELAAPATAALQPDPDTGRVMELLRERAHLDILIGSAPDLALDTVVDQAARRR